MRQQIFEDALEAIRVEAQAAMEKTVALAAEQNAAKPATAAACAAVLGRAIIAIRDQAEEALRRD